MKKDPAGPAITRGGRGEGPLASASYLLDLLTLDDGVVPPYLFRPMLAVVKGAAVLVAVAVHGAEQPITPARESCQPNLLLTHLAFVFLLLSCILVWAGWVQVLRGRRPALFAALTLLRRCPAHLCEGGNRGLSSGGGSRRGLMEGSSWGGRARGCRRGGGGHTGGRLLLLLEGILVAL